MQKEENALLLGKIKKQQEESDLKKEENYLQIGENKKQKEENILQKGEIKK